MELTHDQIAAARAVGFAFSPANDEQIRRLTMQRRIFHIDGKPHLASANGTYFETHSTLLAMLDEQISGGTEARAMAEASQLPAAPTEPLTAAAIETPNNASMATGSQPDPAPATMEPADAINVVGSEPPGEAVAAHEPHRSMLQRRRATEPKLPRWMTAGKARRGRLK